ncbi:MAG: heme biosynthesis HemY N-terminal domain-containing protein [Rubrivivax sp.]|jgi:HemY protein
MRGVIWLVLLFVVAVVAATTLGSNDGLVTIYWSGWRTDLSLNLFVLLVVGGCFLLLSAAQALSALLSLPQRASEWRALKRERAAQAALRQALGEYFSARYSRAHRAAAKALTIQGETPELQDDQEFRLLGHLLAAGSLHRLQDRPRRDALMAPLLQSLRKGGGSEDGARLLAAEWALDDRDAPRALELLAGLPPGVARRTQALRLKLQAARLARQPMDALHTARLLANHQAFTPAAATGLLRSLAFEVLESAHDVQQLRRLWEQFDHADRRDAQVAARAAQRAVRLQACEDARLWLRPFWERLAELPREDRDSVALALAAAVPGLGTDWLPRLESAATQFAHEPAVLAAVGAAFAERQLWGKARRLLEQAAGAPNLPGDARRQAWRLLARLARSDGDEARALRCEQAAAAIDG